MQKLPWFGKLDLKKAMQQNMAKSKKAEYDALKNSLFSQIEQLYYDYWYLQQSLRVTGENVKLLESLEPIIRNRIKVGEGSKDLIKLQIEIGKLTDVIDNLKLRRIPLDAQLNQMLNRPIKAQVGLVALLGKTSEKWDEDELLGAVLNHPGIQKFNFMKNAAVNKVDLANKNRYPDFTVGLKWIQTDDSFMNTRENGKDPVMATLGFTVPWDQKKYDGLESAAKSDERAIDWARLEFKNSLQVKLQTLYEIEDNQRVLMLYRDTLIPKTEESLNITLEAYRNSKESFIGFVDIQRQLLNFQLVLERSRRNIAKQKAMIEELTGQKFRLRESIMNKQKLQLVVCVIGALLLGIIGFVVGKSMSGVNVNSKAEVHKAHQAKETVWTCSMHPQIKLNKPGKCPICAMDLIPLKPEDLGPREIKLSKTAEALANIEALPAFRKEFYFPVRMVGKISLDETRSKKITSRYARRIDRLFVDYTGIQVKEEHLFEIYSPALVTAQEELLQAIESAKSMKNSTVEAIRKSSEKAVEASRDKLRL